MKFTFFLIMILFVNLSYSQIKSKPITEFSQKHTKSIVLIDVRTAAEYDAGHLENAININWYDPQFINKSLALDKENTVYLYCKKGGRSAKAASTLDSLGYNVVNLTGGYDAYKNSQEID